MQKDSSSSVEKPDSKNASKAESTRHQLMEAARKIFAREGFEHARLEDIAAAAGKTRGAFYSNFKDKEDVFFAIFEQDLDLYESRILQHLSTASTRQERVEALVRHLVELVVEGSGQLLDIEFKLYTFRRPERARRLANLHRTKCLQCAEARIYELMPELQDIDEAQRRAKAAIFGAVLDGLTLSRLFDPAALNIDQTTALIRAAVQIALGQSSPS